VSWLKTTSGEGAADPRHLLLDLLIGVERDSRRVIAEGAVRLADVRAVPAVVQISNDVRWDDHDHEVSICRKNVTALLGRARQYRP
jgi:hypothetical protein